MRVFVTGTAGFIGYHLAERLLSEDHEVTGYDGMTPYYDVRLKELRHARLARHEGFHPVIAMLEDQERLADAIASARPDIVVHLAAQAGVRYSLENPRAYLDSNLIGSFNVLEAAAASRPAHLLLASTSSIYGASPDVPFREASRADEPLTVYAASKKAMESMAHAYAHLHEVPTTAFRFFTVYGPWGRPDMALFQFVEAALEGRSIDVYGEGRMRRDCTAVDDLVEAVMRLLPIAPAEANRVASSEATDTLSREAPFRTVNIGGGRPVALMDFVDAVERALGTPIRRNLLPMQPGDVPQTFASPELLCALTGYAPDTPIEETIGRFVAWYRDDWMPFARPSVRAAQIRASQVRAPQVRAPQVRAGVGRTP